MIVEDVEANPDFEPYRATASEVGFRAVHSTPLTTRSGRIIGVLIHVFSSSSTTDRAEVYLLDLCARQAVDAIENARLYSQVREADRRKDEFLATLAHELRNPLAPIGTPSRFFCAWAAGPSVAMVPRRDRASSPAHGAAVDDLLDLSRITTGKVELRMARSSLAKVLNAAVETSWPMIQAGGHELIADRPPESLKVNADLARLAQVVAILLNNAAKYMDRGGRIWLTAARDGTHAVITVAIPASASQPKFCHTSLTCLPRARGPPIAPRTGWASDSPWSNDSLKCTGERSRLTAMAPASGANSLFECPLANEPDEPDSADAESIRAADIASHSGRRR